MVQIVVLVMQKHGWRRFLLLRYQETPVVRKQKPYFTNDLHSELFYIDRSDG